MRNKCLIPTTKDWFSKLDSRTPSRLWSMAASNPGLSAAVKCFVTHLLDASQRPHDRKA